MAIIIASSSVKFINTELPNSIAPLRDIIEWSFLPNSYLTATQLYSSIWLDLSIRCWGWQNHLGEVGFFLPALPISEHSKGPKKNHLIKNFCMHTQQLFDNHCHWLDNPCYYVKHLQTLITSLWSKVLPASFFLVILVQISITWYTVYRLVPGHHQACNSYWVHKVLHHSIAECPGIYLKKC